MPDEVAKLFEDFRKTLTDKLDVHQANLTAAQATVAAEQPTVDEFTASLASLDAIIVKLSAQNTPVPPSPI